MKQYLYAFKNIFNYKDEAKMNDFWYFFLIHLVVRVLIMQLEKRGYLSSYISGIYDILGLLALLSVGFRRLKNAGLSGFLFFIPVINIVLAMIPEKNNSKLN